MALKPLEVKIKVPLWVTWYIRAVRIFSLLMGREPDYDKICRLIKRHLKVK